MVLMKNAGGRPLHHGSNVHQPVQPAREKSRESMRRNTPEIFKMIKKCRVPGWKFFRISGKFTKNFEKF
ncbi:MAG: hypothetical protein WC586_02905 [Methanoregula sp.]